MSLRTEIRSVKLFFSNKRIPDRTLGGCVPIAISPGGLFPAFCQDPLQPLTCPRPLNKQKASP